MVLCLASKHHPCTGKRGVLAHYDKGRLLLMEKHDILIRPVLVMIWNHITCAPPIFFSVFLSLLGALYEAPYLGCGDFTVVG